MSFGYYRGQRGQTPTYIPIGGNVPAPRSTSPFNAETLIKGEPLIEEVAPIAPRHVVGHDTARLSGYTGDMCINPDCQSFKVRKNGTCTVCENCGQTTGCS